MSANPISSGNDINEEETPSDNSSKGLEVGSIATSTTEKDKVLKLIAQQLKFYELHDLAEAIQEKVGLSEILLPDSKLAKFCEKGLKPTRKKARLNREQEEFMNLVNLGSDDPSEEEPEEEEDEEEEQDMPEEEEDEEMTEEATIVNINPTPPMPSFEDTSLNNSTSELALPNIGKYPPVKENNHVIPNVLDLSYEVRGPKPAPNFVTVFKATHKDACGSARFSKDGKLCATASSDTSIKIIDVEKAKIRAEGVKPVIRTLYGHVAPVSDVAFHPNGQMLASASFDKTMKLYDMTKAANKRAIHSVQDCTVLNSLDFHPSGDYIIVGTDDSRLRLYDTNTLKCFNNLRATPTNQLHCDGINSVRFSPNTSSFIASAGEDGDIRLWDTLTGGCVRVIADAHEKWPVSMVQISSNEKYLLSTGRDSAGKLWDLGTGKLIHSFEGATQMNYAISTSFNYNEDYVFSSDEQTYQVVCWDSRTGKLLMKWKGHEQIVRCIAASPVENSFVSCSDDHRARFWTWSK